MNIDRENAYFQVGAFNENLILPIIREKFGSDLQKVSYEFSVFDFESPTHFVELKARSNNYNTYFETMVGYNKFCLGTKKLKQGKKVFFVFAFINGSYFWELTEENFDTIGGENQIRIGGTASRGYEDYKKHLYIPIQYLTRFNDVGSNMKILNSYKSKSVVDGVCFLCKKDLVNKI